MPPTYTYNGWNAITAKTETDALYNDSVPPEATGGKEALCTAAALAILEVCMRTTGDLYVCIDSMWRAYLRCINRKFP